VSSRERPRLATRRLPGTATPGLGVSGAFYCRQVADEGSNLVARDGREWKRDQFGGWLGDCVAALEETIALLIRFGVCADCCPGDDDHVCRYHVARSAAVALGALQAAKDGYLELTVVAARVLFEYADLYTLLDADQLARDCYKAGPSAEWRDRFDPLTVQRRLDELGLREMDDEPLQVRLIGPPALPGAIREDPGVSAVRGAEIDDRFPGAINALAYATVVFTLRVLVGDDLCASEGEALALAANRLSHTMHTIAFRSMPDDLSGGHAAAFRP
jgi:hypothetical protein